MTDPKRRPEDGGSKEDRSEKIDPKEVLDKHAKRRRDFLKNAALSTVAIPASYLLVSDLVKPVFGQAYYAVPEPANAALIGAGAAGIAALGASLKKRVNDDENDT